MTYIKCILFLLLSTTALAIDGVDHWSDYHWESGSSWSFQEIGFQSCIRGPFEIRWDSEHYVIATGEGGFCVSLRGHVSFAWFANGIYAYNEYGEFTPVIVFKPNIQEFNYGVH